MKIHVLTLALCAFIPASAYPAEKPKFLEDFPVKKSDLLPTGKSDYFVLEPGFVAVFEGAEDGEKTVLTITVTDRKKTVDDVETRVVEERETKGGQLVEISRNYMAISKTSGDVYYFGEDTDIYKNGKVVDHEGSWLSGVAGARFGLLLPGKPKIGDAYYQEQAPRIAMDRAVVVSANQLVKTPAGEFKKCIKTEETTPIEKGTEHKFYAPGVGLVQEAALKLVKYGGGTK
jgi:hypothetical protein